MADYRNIPVKFSLGGLDLTTSPENVEAGKGTRMLNVRPTQEHILQGRRGTGIYEVPQPTLAGYDTPYPSFWNLGDLKLIRYIGKVIDSDDNSVDGYFTIHEAPSTGTDTGLLYFINGMPLIRKYCDTTPDPLVSTVFEYATKVPAPSGLSVLRASAKNGVPIIIIDGKYFVRLNQIDYGSPDTTNSNVGDVGSANLAAVPGIYTWDLGVGAPTIDSIASSGDASSNLSASTAYSYRITWYDSNTGFESPASTAVTYTTTATPHKPRLTWSKPDPNDVGNAGMDQVRIYRQGDTISGGERLVDTVTLEFQTCALGGGTTTYDDDIADTTIALATLIDSDSVEPFTSVTAAGVTSTAQKFPQAFGPFNARTIFWVGDPVRQNVVYWNKEGNLSLTNSTNDVASVSDSAEELLNGFIFGGSPFMWSRKKLYQLVWNGTGIDPEFTPQEIPLGIGSVGKNSFAVGVNLIAVCAADGIYLTTGQPETPICITDDSLKPLFRGTTVGSIEGVNLNQPDDIYLAATAKEIHFIYPGIDSGALFHLVYDLQGQRWFQWSSSTYTHTYVNEAPGWHQLLFGRQDSQLIYIFDDVYENSSETFTMRIRGGSYDSDIPLTHKEFGTLMLDFDPDGADITITPYYDSEEVVGTALTTDTLNDTDGRRVATFSLGDVYYKSLALDFSWSETPTKHPTIYQGNLLFRDDEEAIVHWEHPDTSLGQASWFHIRDSFWALRSTAAVTLTVVVDGQTNTYTLASTSGDRRKVYAELRPLKGKVVSFKLDSTAPFRFYGEDSVLFVKKWVTQDTYEKISPFTAAGYAQYRRTEGGT